MQPSTFSWPMAVNELMNIDFLVNTYRYKLKLNGFELGGYPSFKFIEFSMCTDSVDEILRDTV